MALIPPQPVNSLPGSFFWNDWIEKIRTVVNTLLTSIDWGLIQNTPTTLSGYGITDGQSTAEKDVASGYAGLNAASRTTKGVDTSDYIIVDSTTHGFTAKSPNGHYWVMTISNAGVVTWTDVGTTKP